MTYTPKRLHFSAPRRASVETNSGTYTTRPWELQDVRSAFRAGAWFEKGKHEFDSQETAEYALNVSRR